jgi:hypothetical protein
LVRLFFRLLLWAVVLSLVLVWLLAAGSVWIVEAIIAWRRKTHVPSFTVPRATSDPKFGRTAGAAVVVVLLLMLFGSGGTSGTPQPVQAASEATSRASLAESPASGSRSSTAGVAASTTPADADADAAAKRRAERRAARARAARRAARAKVRAERRAAKARAERRRRRAREARDRRIAAAAARQSCDPNYKGACLDPNAGDYDCEGGSGDGPKYTGIVRSVGSDPFDLDRDGDGVGCDA